ncbi:MAG TPA: hypothetical protein VEA99_04440 [Gemmatimonadaceae bacterium]|nr:hypothetical protein [Gemmatimonadaceae bacterium]
MNRTLPLLLVAFALSGCAALRSNTSGPRWQESGRVARNLPTMFVADTTNRDAQPTLGAGCSTRLVDPRDGNLLMLARSQELETGRAADVTRSPTRDNIPPTRPAQRDVRGDYSVSYPERYGVTAGELLRIDCVTGRGLGIVERE